jgi:hypothetical protein
MSRISAKLEAKIRREFRNRCSYCLLPQKILSSLLEIEHILATSNGGTDDEYNLCLACRSCNGFKSNKMQGIDAETNQSVSLFNPRTQIWNEHFEFAENYSKLKGKTPCGRVTIIALQMNGEQAVTARKNWVIAGWYPPKD